MKALKSSASLLPGNLAVLIGVEGDRSSFDCLQYSFVFCILQVIKSWMVGVPGNEATRASSSGVTR